MRALSGSARIAGVVGWPVRQSLSPLLHNAWIDAAGLDAAYVPFPLAPERFAPFVQAMRGGGVAGVNVTLPHKEAALALANTADAAARSAGAANLLLFAPDGSVAASNTDGLGLLRAFAEQAPSWRPDAGPVLVLGAGGAGRGAAAALQAAGAEVRVANRTEARAQALAEALPGVFAYAWERLDQALDGVTALVNATAAGLEGSGALTLPWARLPLSAVVMDMVYKPLRTGLLREAEARGHSTVDGLAMLIGQARPSFQALFGRPPPAGPDVRALALKALGEA